jgi:hypothetical protein
VGVQLEESATTPVPAPEALPEVALDDPGLVAFSVAGAELAGEFRCADCGYGAVIQRVLPVCPMCGGSVWEQHGRGPAHFAD